MNYWLSVSYAHCISHVNCYCSIAMYFDLKFQINTNTIKQNKQEIKKIKKKIDKKQTRDRILFLANRLQTKGVVLKLTNMAPVNFICKCMQGRNHWGGWG